MVFLNLTRLLIPVVFLALVVGALGSASNGPTGLYALGLDYFNVFSSSKGDIGTLVFQPYLVRLDARNFVPDVSSKESNSGLIWRMANFNFTGLGRGRANVRVGHFELPFGLEQIAQTNGTLNQMNALANTGLKTDWGVSLNGEVPGLEYELGFMRGGGNGLKTDANGYFVGRIGLPRYNAWWLGVSGVSGELEVGGDLTDLDAVAIDGGVRFSSGLHLMLEYTAQEIDSVSNRHLFSELGYTSRSEALVTYFQWRLGDTPINFGSANIPRAALGLRYEPSRWWSASMEVQRRAKSERGSRAFLLQLRFRS